MLIRTVEPMGITRLCRPTHAPQQPFPTVATWNEVLFRTLDILVETPQGQFGLTVPREYRLTCQ